mgnify:CR=1 FL=1
MSNSPSHSQLNTRKFGKRIWQFIRSHLRLFSRHPCNYKTNSLVLLMLLYTSSYNILFCLRRFPLCSAQFEILLMGFPFCSSATVIQKKTKLWHWDTVSKTQRQLDSPLLRSQLQNKEKIKGELTDWVISWGRDDQSLLWKTSKYIPIHHLQSTPISVIYNLIIDPHNTQLSVGLIAQYWQGTALALQKPGFESPFWPAFSLLVK